jgi:hypothetical protein
VQLAITRLSCPACGAPIQVGRGTSSVACPYCGGVARVGGATASSDATIEARHAARRTVSAEAFQRRLLRWLSEGDYTPDDLLERALVTHHSSVLLPVWHVRGTFHARFKAEAGFDAVRERVVERRRADGRTERRTETHTVTDWRAVDGEVTGPFEAWACASPVVPAPIVAFVEEVAQRCDAWEPVSEALLADQRIEGFDAGPRDALAAPGPAERLRKVVEAAAARRVPGDRHRALTVTFETRDEDALACLHPFWLASFRYAGAVFPVAVSGRDDAAAHGQRPEDTARKAEVEKLARPWKVALGVTAALTLAGVCLGVAPGLVALAVGGSVTAALGWRARRRRIAILERSRAARAAVLARIGGAAAASNLE